MHTTRFINPHSRLVAAILGGAFLGAGVFVPEVAAYATPAGFVALFLAGLGLQVPQWAVVRPLLPQVLVPTVLAISQALLHPEKLPIPENLKAWAPVAAGVLGLLAGKVIPLQGTAHAPGPEAQQANGGPIAVTGMNMEEALKKAMQLPQPHIRDEALLSHLATRLEEKEKAGLPMLVLLGLAMLPALGSGCAAGPVRESFPQVLSNSKPELAASTEDPPPEAPKASPFSAGIAIAVGVPFKGGQVVPAQLAVGSVKVLDGKRSVSLLAVGGVSGTSISQAEAAWGAGVGVDLTPGTLLYEVDASAGVFWTSQQEGPLGFFGFTLTPKM